MQSFSLAKAKIQVPRFRGGLIERIEFEQRLGDAMATRRLVLLVAPAGYGKTAALSRQLQQLPEGSGVAWLTLDEEDDLQQLLSHLIEALEPLDPPWRLAPEALLDLVTQGRLREAASALLGTLEVTDAANGVIVMDDLHAVTDARVFDFLGHVLEGLPQNWTIVIASRMEPPLALARWRARREMTEFDETDLGFSRKEVQELWRHATGQDDPEQAERLFDQTRGWVAGLCLSLGAPERSAATTPKAVWRDRRRLFDYLASEVLEDLPGDLQAFLLRCSVLPELTVARCEQVTGDRRAAHLLEDLERRRLFVSVLDSDELTLRLHDLFRDFLEEHLRRRHPEEVPTLMRRAAESEATPVRRTLLYLRAGAWDEAQEDLAQTAPDMLACDEGAQVVRMIEQFPAELQARSPWLAYVRGRCAWSHYRYGAVRSAMAQAAAGFVALERHCEAQRARAVQALAMFFGGQMEEARHLSEVVRAGPMDLETETLGELLAFWYEGRHGPVEGPGQRLATMVELLERAGSAELWVRCMTRVNSFIGRPGVSAQIRRMIRGARAVASNGHWSLQASANLMEGWLLLWQGDLAVLETAFHGLEEDSRWLGQPAGSRLRLQTLKVNYQIICDDRDAVHAARDTILEQAALLDPSGDLALASLLIAVRISAAIGDWPAVRMYLPALNVEFINNNPCMEIFRRTFDAQLAFEEGRIGEALAALRELATRSAELDTMFLDATVRTWLARAELADGSPVAAWRALEPLVEKVMASGNIGQVLATGMQVLTELSLAKWGSAASEEGLAALRQWVETARRFKAGSQEGPRASTAGAAGLSGRELEVLALLADSQSNKLIARALDLSPHTIKRHVARILDRLDLSSRLQAANWYRAHFSTAAEAPSLHPEQRFR